MRRLLNAGRWASALALAGFVLTGPDAGAQVRAQTPPTVAAAPTEPVVDLTAFRLVDAVDAQGRPVILRQPLAEGVVTPGDRLVYVATLSNPTAAPVADLVLSAPVPAAVRLDPYSFAGPAGLRVETADAETPDRFQPLFLTVNGEEVLQADPETIVALRLHLPPLEPGGEIAVEYVITLR